MIPLLGNDAIARSHPNLARAARRHQLSDEHLVRLAALMTDAQRASPGCAVRLNTNRRTILSLRGRPSAWTLSIHVGLLDHPQALREIPIWLGARGRRTSPSLRQALHEVWQRQRSVQAITDGDVITGQQLDAVAAPVDLSAMFERVHRSWFPTLPRPAIRWSRASAGRHLYHIRFGSYRRSPAPMIMVNPRLDQPWIARVFIEHVLFHELCHHAQACSPIRGEQPHSERFRAWERSYPHHAEALAWERSNLQRLLAPVSA